MKRAPDESLLKSHEKNFSTHNWVARACDGKNKFLSKHKLNAFLMDHEIKLLQSESPDYEKEYTVSWFRVTDEFDGRMETLGHILEEAKKSEGEERQQIVDALSETLRSLKKVSQKRLRSKRKSNVIALPVKGGVN
jgi:hypothetical protein